MIAPNAATGGKPAKLYDMVDPADGECVLREAEHCLREFFVDADPVLLRRAFADVQSLFHGQYPGYRASNTKYHDFEHTCSVVLAQTRLIHGAMSEGCRFTELDAVKGLLASLYHDVGLIQADEDTQGTGAKYTVGHEERSIQFMRQNLNGSLPADDIEDMADCIRCTILAMPPARIAFRSESMQMMGWFLGSADLLAQIADRYYLEKLLLLFEEFKEARLPGYDTPYDLLVKTRNFYQDVARKRLDNDLGRVDRYMRAYFKHRFGVDRDFYTEAIHRNLDYLDTIVGQCRDDITCFMQSLRRSDAL